jgi:periplasmic mercuric ion binding protein
MRHTLAIIFWLFSGGLAVALPQSVSIAIDTMTCGPDPHNIKAALQALPGVTDVTISLETRMAIISFDNEKSTPDAMLKAIAAAGYAARSEPPKP